MTGCFLSHCHCIEQSLSRSKRALVFEDDVQFEDNWAEKKKTDIENFLSSNNKWDILRLGCEITSFHKASNINDIWLVKAYNTHAIIYNTEIMKHILDNKDISRISHIDDYLHELKKCNDYALRKNICYQKVGLSSDNSWFSSSIIQQFMQHKYVSLHLQKFNNFFIWYVKFLPICIQEYISVWGILIRIGLFIDAIKKNGLFAIILCAFKS